jgi:hypothetical protein
LGCERPAEIVRRSDTSAGWEYAEVSGRALGIRRLLGYDGQSTSAPFIDQSNLNLAYTYSEQPMVHETQPSVAPRNLASVSLVRPAPFDPSIEFSGFEISPQAIDLFRITLPDGGMVCVAPVETTPAKMTVGGVEFVGAGLRYARLQPDHSDVGGLGVAGVAGIAEFSAPSTFRLWREVGDGVRVTTNTAVSLTDDWLGGAARRIEVGTWTGAWVDVTNRCGGTTIPAEVIREWSQRNERTLVDFRLRR